MALKTSLKTHIIRKILDDFAVGSGNSNFVFISRSETWSDEASPPTYLDSTDSYNEVYKRMVAAKRITSLDAYMMIPKNSWVSGSTYGMYTDVNDMASLTRPYYVTNSDNNVYKCIFNGFSGGNTGRAAVSDDSPRGTSLNVTTTSDRYKWKFMFKVPQQWDRFVTDDYIPVKKMSIADGVIEKFDDERQLQYSTQYNSVNGSLSYIDITSQGSSYGNNVPLRNTGLTDQRTYIKSASNGTTVGVAVINDNEEIADDAYNTYSLNIVQGTGVGQYKTILDYVGTSRTVTISSLWDVIPDTTSMYEIMPEVTIDGDGTGAVAISSTLDPLLDVYGITLESVELVNVGKDYTYAHTTIKTTNNGNTATFDSMISPYGGHGSDPISEIPPTRLMLLIRLDREEGGITSSTVDTGSFPIRNDFRQYGILRNPILSSGLYAGKIAGRDVDTVTNIDISAPTGDNFNAGDFVAGDIVFGETTTACGKVLHWYRNTDISKGTLRLLNVNSNFSVGESVIGLGTGGADYTSSGKGKGYVQFQGETDITQTNSHYRLMTYLEIRSTAGSSGHTYTSADFDLDQVIRGASGSTSSIIEFIPGGGQTASLFLSTLIGKSGGYEYGFTFGENLSGVTISSYINTVKPSEFVKGSGEMLYINNVTPITRHNEQEEEIKIIIDI